LCVLSLTCFFFFFFFYCHAGHLDLHSFPTRRSSDLKDCVTIDVLPRTPGNNVYVGFMVWSNFTATKCRGLVSLNQVIKEIIARRDRKSGSAGMPRPISYAVFCLKKKKHIRSSDLTF